MRCEAKTQNGQCRSQAVMLVDRDAPSIETRWMDGAKEKAHLVSFPTYPDPFGYCYYHKKLAEKKTTPITHGVYMADIFNPVRRRV